MKEQSIDGWVVVFQSGTDYEANIVRDRLDDAGITAVVLTHRDHAFNLTIGDMAMVRVMVSPHEKEAAMAVLHSRPVSPEELEAAALAADPVVRTVAETSGDEQGSRE